MRVALVTDTFLPKVDGIVTVLCLLLDHLAARGVEAAVFAPRMGRITHYHGTPVITAPGLPFPFYPDLRVALPTPHIWRRLRAFRPDVIHFAHPSVFGLALYELARRAGYPALVSFHVDYARVAQHFRVGPFSAAFIGPPVNALARHVLNSADAVLTPSRAMRARLVEIGVRREVHLWRRGVDADRFHPRHRSAAMRARLSDHHPDDLLLLYVGRLSPEKRLADLRPALEQVSGVRLALAGDGPARPALERHFAGLPVHFAGYLRGEALAAAYASADVFVFPSALESFGLVVLEAMASGLPVVAARVGGVSEMVVEGVSGWTFAPGDTAALAAGVRRLGSDRARRAVMGQAARAFAETQAWPAMMDEVIGHYARLASKSSN
jgi:glycosyltransferase involved in cell wall biosynthesis